MIPFLKLVSFDNIPILLQMMEDFYAIDSYVFHLENTETNLNMLFKNPSLGIIFMIQLASEVIEYVCLTFGFSLEYNGKFGLIDELYFKEKHRGFGYGRIILRQIFDKSKSLEINSFHLEVEKKNGRVRQLYISEGFEENGRDFLVKKMSKI